MRNSTKWFISLVHGVLLFLFSVWWLNSNLTYGDERFLVKWSSVFKRVILRIDDPPPKKDFLFINLAYDKALIPRENGLGKDVITDRKLLADFLSILQRNQSKVTFTVCDVLLQGSSPDDSLLQQSVRGIKNIIFPSVTNDSGKTENLAIQVPSAPADYEIAKEGFLKFRLLGKDGKKSLPVYMYEQIEKKNINISRGIPFDGNRPMMQSLIIDYQIRPYALLQAGAYPMIPLSELLQLPEEVIVNDFLKNRIIMIGDYEHDVHETVFGSTPGTLILLNVYLNMKAGRHLIHVAWLLFIVLGFTVLSKLMLFPDKEKNRRGSGWWASLVRNVTFLSVLSVVSYLVFNMHIQVLILAVYLNSLRFILQLKKSDLQWKNLKDWFLQLREIFFNFK
jgi:hypothetical protein